MSSKLKRDKTVVLPKIKLNKNSTKEELRRKYSKIKSNINIMKMSDKNVIFNSIAKKPSTSIDYKKPIHILPKIQIKQLSNTANIKGYNTNAINNIVNSENLIEQKYEYYGKIALDLLNNDKELKDMYEELYNNNDENNKKEWIERHLLKKEIFKVKIDVITKKNEDVSLFIRNEIWKILNNKTLDNLLIKSLKAFKCKYKEYVNNMYNL